MQFQKKNRVKMQDRNCSSQSWHAFRLFWLFLKKVNNGTVLILFFLRAADEHSAATGTAKTCADALYGSVRRDQANTTLNTREMC
jgi:hypothetical protein